MKSFIRGMTGKVAKETAEATAKAVASGGDEVAKGLASAWAGRTARVAGQTSEQVATQAAKITDEIVEATAIATKSSDKIVEHIRTGNKSLRDGIGVLEREIITDTREIQRLIRTTQPVTEIGIERLNPEALHRVEQMIKFLETDVAAKTIKKRELYKLLTVSSIRGQEKVALDMITRNPDLLGVNANIQGWHSSLLEAQNLGKTVLKYKSKNLNNDTAFIKEFITLNRNPALAKKLELWSSNPQNFAKLEKLIASDRIVAMISAGKLSMRQKLLGVTMGDTAKRLGVSVTTLAAGYGAVKIYSWFDDNDPAVIATQGTSVGSTVKSLNVSGQAATILKEVQSSLRNIILASSRVNTALSGNNASKLAKGFVMDVSDEVGKLVRLLDKWDIVVNSVKENGGSAKEAIDVGKKLALYANSLTSVITDLRKQLGLSDIGVASKVSPRDITPGADKDNLTKIQGFLRLDKTGLLDRSTIKALRNLEYRFNKRARTDQFTGTFVLPEISHVVSYDNLVIAYQKIQKY